MTGIRPENPDLGCGPVRDRPVITGHLVIYCACCQFEVPRTIFGIMLMDAHVGRHHPLDNQSKPW